MKDGFGRTGVVAFEINDLIWEIVDPAIPPLDLENEARPNQRDKRIVVGDLRIETRDIAQTDIVSQTIEGMLNPLPELCRVGNEIDGHAIGMILRIQRIRNVGIIHICLDLDKLASLKTPNPWKLGA